MKLPPFSLLLEEHGAGVYGFLVALCGPADAEDCWQETWLAALGAYPKLTRADNLRAWLLTIARNKARDAHRARARRPIPAASLPDAPAPPPPESDPSLWSLVASLPAKQRSALALRFASDLAYKDIAAVMECSEPAARQSVRQGLRKLREVL